MTLLVRRIRSVEPEVNLLGHPSLPAFHHPLPDHSSPDRDAWRVPVLTTQYPGLIQNTPNTTFLSWVSSFVAWPDIKYRKIFQVPASFCRPVSVHSQETNVLCISTFVYFPSRVERAAWICIRISFFFRPFYVKKHAINSSSKSNSFCGDWFGRIGSTVWI